MKYGFCQAGVMQDVIMTAPHLIFDAGYARQFIAVPDQVQNGWLYNGTTFSPPPTAPASVPQSVTMRQARLALLAAGKLAAVAPAIASMPSPAKEQAQIEWEYSITVERQRPFVLAMGPALGLDSAALDALFIAAAKL